MGEGSTGRGIYTPSNLSVLRPSCIVPCGHTVLARRGLLFRNVYRDWPAQTEGERLNLVTWRGMTEGSRRIAVENSERGGGGLYIDARMQLTLYMCELRHALVVTLFHLITRYALCQAPHGDIIHCDVLFTLPTTVRNSNYINNFSALP